MYSTSLNPDKNKKQDLCRKLSVSYKTSSVYTTLAMNSNADNVGTDDAVIGGQRPKGRGNTIFFGSYIHNKLY